MRNIVYAALSNCGECRESVVDESELEDSYIEADEDMEDMLLDTDESDELFEGLDDEDLFDSDLAEDNLDNDGLE